MKNITATLIAIVVSISCLFAQDYKVEDLPFYKLGQLEKEKLYLKTAKDFVEASNALVASKYISDTSPGEIADFTKAYRAYHQKRTGEVKDDLIIFGFRGNQFAHITMQSGEKIQSVIQMVWEKDFETPKVDWRASYGHSETGWDEFFETNPQVPTSMRVRLATGTYYNFKYGDDKKWACLKCYHPFLKRELFAYVDREDPEFIAIVESIRARGHLDVTAELCYPEEVKDKSQVEIVKILHSTWYARDYYAEK